jgi:hypothetical protein
VICAWGLYALNPKCLTPQFLADHVRLEDVRLYLRDLLREYAALQTFQPFRSEEARCMNWDRMLAEFSAPHRRPSYVRSSSHHLPAALPVHLARYIGTAIGGRKRHIKASRSWMCAFGLLPVSQSRCSQRGICEWAAAAVAFNPGCAGQRLAAGVHPRLQYLLTVTSGIIAASRLLMTDYCTICAGRGPAGAALPIPARRQGHLLLR